MDFFLNTYRTLLKTLKTKNFYFYTFYEFLQRKQTLVTPLVILRHDVDRLPNNALKMATLEKELGIQSTYYFRAISGIFRQDIIQQIADMGHEIGYHYEDMSLAARKKVSIEPGIMIKKVVEGSQYAETHNQQPVISNKKIKVETLIDKGYELFRQHLKQFRQYYSIKTICMHGSPRSKWDSRDIWKKYDYKNLDIVGEPYFDVDYNQVLYLTDTGRRWDGWKMNIRDKVANQEKWKNKGYVFHSTKDIIRAANNKMLPNKIMINTHPQRWTDKPLPWVKELVWQNIKNMGKFIIVKMRG